MRAHDAEHFLVVLWGHGEGLDYHVAMLKGDPPVPSLIADVGKSSTKDVASFVAKRLSRPTATFKHTNPVLRGLAGSLKRISLKEELPKSIHYFSEVLLDFSSGQDMRNDELRNALKHVRQRSGRQIDVLGMDACLMGMAEVDYQLRKSVECMTASESLVPYRSWPYDRILRRLEANPEMPPATLGKVIVREYANFYHRQPVSISACNLARSKKLASAVRGLGKELMRRLDDNAVLHAVEEARGRAQNYRFGTYVDLYDFCRRLAQHKGTRPRRKIRIMCNKIAGRLIGRKGMIVAERHNGKSLARSAGVSIYFPNWVVVNGREGRKLKNKKDGKGGESSGLTWKDYAGIPTNMKQAERKIKAAYSGLDFAKDTNWDKFLLNYLRTRGSLALTSVKKQPSRG
jgi:hypothetical protein